MEVDMPSTSSITTSFFGVALAAAISGSLILWCQQPSPQLSPRELYYREQAPDHDQRAPVAPSKKQGVDKATGMSQKKVDVSAPPRGSTQEGTGQGAIVASVEKISTATTTPEVSHLGLRYNLLLVDKTTGDAKPVSSNRVFDQGECLSIEFQSNRSGYLYVFNLGSSGAWKPLLPTEEMSDEGNFLPALTTVRVPAAHCFRVAGPPGSERLFVVLSRNPREVNELNRTIRKGAAGEPEHPLQREAGGEVLTAANNLNQELQIIRSLKSRDLEIQEVGDTEGSNGVVPAVYVVHASATPSDRVVAEIRIAHR
jgi:hypothetical protein